MAIITGTPGTTANTSLTGGTYLTGDPADLSQMTNAQSGNVLAGSSVGSSYDAWKNGPTYSSDLAAAQSYLSSRASAPAPAPAPVASPAVPGQQPADAAVTASSPTAGSSNPTTATTTDPNAAHNDVQNWYRNVLGRDPDATGLAYWQNVYNTQGSQAAYDAMIASANQVQPGSAKTMSMADASNPYGGTLSGSGNSVVDEWARNLYGRNATPQEIAAYSGGDVQQQFDAFKSANGAPKTDMNWFQASQLGAGSGGIVSGGANGTNGYTPWNVTPEQTVEGRINAIINPNSPMNVAVATGVKDAYNARGLLNSGMAVSAGQSAVINNAIPIASADAATYAKASGYNADIQNQMSMQQAQLANQMGIANLQSDTQKQIATLNANTQTYMANLDAQTKTTLQGLQNQNSLLIQTNSQAATIFNQAVAAISTIQNNDKMDANSKTQAISNLMQNLNNQFSAMSKASGVNVSLNLSNYPGFDAQGNYVGFNADGTTRGNTSTTSNPNDQTPASNPFENVLIDGGGP